MRSCDLASTVTASNTHRNVQMNSVVESSWINASLLWAKATMQIPSDDIYELNMTDGLPAGVGNAFQASSPLCMKVPPHCLTFLLHNGRRCRARLSLQ